VLLGGHRCGEPAEPAEEEAQVGQRRVQHAEQLARLQLRRLAAGRAALQTGRVQQRTRRGAGERPRLGQRLLQTRQARQQLAVDQPATPPASAPFAHPPAPPHLASAVWLALRRCVKRLTFRSLSSWHTNVCNSTDESPEPSTASSSSPGSAALTAGQPHSAAPTNPRWRRGPPARVARRTWRRSARPRRTRPPTSRAPA